MKGTPGPHTVSDLATLSARLAQADRADRLTDLAYDRVPFTTVYYLRGRAHIELAKAYALAADRSGTELELRRALGLLPGNSSVIGALRRVQSANTTALYSAIKNV